MTHQNKLIVWVAGSVLLLAVVIGTVFFVRTGSSRPESTTADSSLNTGSESDMALSSSANNGDEFKRQYGNTCDKNANPTFTHSPLSVDKIGGIEPLGRVSDGHVTPVDHVYVSPIDSTVADNTYDVVMPADGTLVDVGRMPDQYIGDRSDVKLAQDDFRMVISFSCRYYSIFIHVHKLSDTVAAAVGTIKPNETKRISLKLKAGDVLAHLGGSSFDWTMVDTQTNLTGFITPSYYESEPWKIHTIDPFSMYSGSLKTSLEAKSLRTVAPFGGKIDWDKQGALIGNWYKEGTKGYQGASQDRYWDGHLAIAPHNIDPTGVIYSVGNWNGKAGQYLVKGDFKPEDITAESGIVKIELMNITMKNADGSPFTGGVFKRGMILDKSSSPVVGVVLLQVQAGEKLKLEQFPGKTAAQVSGFTPAAVTFER